ncbi:RluA family pseudouridine synthase [Nibricoccus sp. IMCC34717]|uniref:RluA family pseudouridine synthase n=1 Tax=Nibricoccus sp. IMCC34717 TaxID=3034021 RepID=UPI00384DA1E9
MPLPPIVYEDEQMLAFDKPSGLLIAPDRWDKKRENLMGLVHAKLGKGVANVHRLDADTSGVVLCAKTKPALDFLSGEFQSRMAEKRYVALCAVLPAERAMKLKTPILERDATGRPPETFEIDLALGEDESNPGRMRVHSRRGGKESQTLCRVVEWFGTYALLECRPLTGRTHQIRIHLAAAGLPVLNDPFYGDPTVRLLLSSLKRGYKGRDEEKPLVDRLALHAADLTVRHPVTREPVTISAPVPREFEVGLKYLRKFGGGKVYPKGGYAERG